MYLTSARDLLRLDPSPSRRTKPVVVAAPDYGAAPEAVQVGTAPSVPPSARSQDFTPITPRARNTTHPTHHRVHVSGPKTRGPSGVPPGCPSSIECGTHPGAMKVAELDDGRFGVAIASDG